MKIIKNKVGLIHLAQELGSISKACKIMGYSRETCYRYQETVERGGVEALLEKPRHNRPNLENRVDGVIEKRVIAYAIALPAHGQLRTRNELRKGGVVVSLSGVRSVWLRNN